MPGQGDFPGNFNVRMTWTPPTFGVKVLESNTGTPGSFTDVSSSASSFGSVCVNHTSLSSDVSNNHSWRQGETVFFEVETVNNLGVTGPPSNVVSITLPVYNGSSGTVSTGQNGSAIITPGQPNDSIDITWPNPLQGYRALYGHAPTGPFSTVNDEGFQIEREVPGFVYQSADPSGTRECFEIQGYDQTGHLGPISAAACYQQP